LSVAVAALAVASITTFVTIYRDMLGPVPLPPLTLLALRFQPLWLVLVIIFAVVTLYVMWRWRLRPAPDGISVVLILLPAAQAAFLFVALLQPVVGTIVRQNPADPLIQPAR